MYIVMNPCSRYNIRAMLIFGAVRGVGDKNADMELAELADVLPAENYSSNAPGLELDDAAASAAVPELSEGSSPVQDPPPGSSPQRDGADSPGWSRLVSHMHSWLNLHGSDMYPPTLALARTCHLATEF